MLLLIYATVNIKTVLLWLECRHGDICATDQWYHQQRLLHSNSGINQMPPQIIHILRFLCGRLAALDFVMKWQYWGQACLVTRRLEVLRVSYIIALSDWRSCHSRHSWRKSRIYQFNI